MNVYCKHMNKSTLLRDSLIMESFWDTDPTRVHPRFSMACDVLRPFFVNEAGSDGIIGEIPCEFCF